MARIVAVTLLTVLASAQFDGNPHKWDRIRRCDHFDYDPPCGACEGIGGMVSSDKLTDFNATTCEPVKDPIDPSKLKPPVWAPDFSVVSHEILIGKNVQGCMQAFPWNDSIGEHCYKPQDVTLYSDMTNKRAIHEDFTQEGASQGLLGNVTGKIMHQGPNMWIFNHIPNGSPPPEKIFMVVCTQPADGGDHSKPGVRPIQYNWTNNLNFVAREKIGVEYIWKTQVLDHWAFGPHHAWVDPETGVIVRMWQPFNGLQVFEPGTWKAEKPDPALFGELCTDGKCSPADAKKNGSANVRIKCTDDGFWSNESTVSVQDLTRARTKVPRTEYKGSSFQSMSKTLNHWLLKHAPNSRKCEEWSVEELQQLQRTLLGVREPELDAVYQSTNDNRRLKTPLDKEWAELNSLAAKDPMLKRLRRDGHCHETVMWYVHHLSEHAKSQLKKVISLPLLPETSSDISQFTPEMQAVIKAYEDHVTCASCHSAAHPESIVV
jgi:hypothetical protein